MKTKINRVTRKCDMCAEEAVKDEGSYGNDPFIGWITVERVFNPVVSSVPDPLDFCDSYCMQSYFEGGGTWYGKEK